MRKEWLLQGEEELNQELKVLGGLHHRHLINLYGWCPEVSPLVHAYDNVEQARRAESVFSYCLY